MEKFKYLCNPSSSVTRVSYEHVWSATVDARSICIGRLLDNQCFLPRFYRLLNLYSIEMDCRLNSTELLVRLASKNI